MLSHLTDIPELIEQYDYSKNIGIHLLKLTKGSDTKIWWKCFEGPDHEWQATVKDRARNLSGGCPFCSGKKLSVTNSLAAKFPEVAKEWHPSKNGELGPDQIVAGSNKVVWWKCPNSEDHEWQARVIKRWHSGGRGCPFCAGKKVSKSTSLAHRYPILCKEWHTEKNTPLKPTDVPSGSKKKVWWQCTKDNTHSWEATINNRVSNESGCPFCSGNQISIDKSLGVLFPLKASQWDEAQNAPFTPFDVSPGSDLQFWWICKKGDDHRWRTNVKSRTKANASDCPFCSGRKLSQTNSLLKLSPGIAAQWLSEKNQKTPDKVLNGSHHSYWWQCPQGLDHQWKASTHSRTGRYKAGCPYCSGQKASITNSLKALYPDIAIELHDEKNNKLNANEIVAKSGKKLWWKCSINPSHEWQATPHNRVRGHSCPYCHVVPRSRQELIFAFELLLFLDFEINDHKIFTENRVLDVDIILRKNSIVIEYDGSYWHKNKGENDIEKIEILKNLGWTTIRVREKPLKRLTENDVSFRMSDIKEATDGTLKKLISLGVLNELNTATYFCNDGLMNTNACTEYIRELLLTKNEHK